MTSVLVDRNIAALGDLVRLSDGVAETAAGIGDATTVTGSTIDRGGFGNGSMPDSALLGVLYSATLGIGKTLSITATVQDSSDNATFADYSTVAATVAATAPSGGGIVHGEYNVPVNLRSARRYIRFNYMPDLSATATDTSVTCSAGFFAGFDRLPASNN